jgi:hypothetical protein
MIFDIDRVNVMLFKAGLPTVEQGDLKRVANRRNYSLIAFGLNRLERHYGLRGRDDERMTLMTVAGPGYGLPAYRTVGQRIIGLELYQDLCADPRKPYKITRDIYIDEAAVTARDLADEKAD